MKTTGAGVAAVVGGGGGGTGSTGVSAGVAATGAGVGTTVRDLVRVLGRAACLVAVLAFTGGSMMPFVVHVSLSVCVLVMGRVCVLDDDYCVRDCVVDDSEVGPFCDSVRLRFTRHAGYAMKPRPQALQVAPTNPGMQVHVHAVLPSVTDHA